MIFKVQRDFSSPLLGEGYWAKEASFETRPQQSVRSSSVKDSALCTGGQDCTLFFNYGSVAPFSEPLLQLGQIEGPTAHKNFQPQPILTTSLELDS